MDMNLFFLISMIIQSTHQTPCAVGTHIEMHLIPPAGVNKRCNPSIKAQIKWQSVIVTDISGKSVTIEMPRIPVKVAVRNRFVTVALKKDGIRVYYIDCRMKVREVHKYKGYFSVESFRFTEKAVIPLSSGVEICMDKRALEKYIAANRKPVVRNGGGLELVLGGAGLSGSEPLLQTTGFRMMFHIKGPHIWGLNINAFATEKWGAVTVFSYRWRMDSWVYTDFMPALFFGTSDELTGGFVISPVVHMDFDDFRIGVQLSVGYGFSSPPRIFVSGALLFGLLF